MLFNSEIFLFFFLPICIIAFYIIKFSKYKFETLFLSIFSLFFYSWNEPKWLILLLTSISINFLLANLIYKNNKKHLIIIGVIFNISLIGWFKYRYFLLNSFLSYNIENNLIIPLAISFFTFQQIAFLVDIHDNRTKPLKFVDHLFYVSFFPQLIAGPIVLAKDIVPQIIDMKNKVRINNLFILGFVVFFVGLFKKVFLADNLAPYIEVGFNHIYNSLTFIEAWAIISGFALQLYFDFSGYSEMAVGLGLLFGIRLPINFNIPFRATSMIDFWKRWHISVTKFFMLYLYAPISLYLNRLNLFSSSANLIFLLVIPTLITFFISGLWHGANWKFVLFGLINGFGLIINHLWKTFKMPKLPLFCNWLLTMIIVLISFVFFRASSTAEAFYFLSIMFNPTLLVIPQWIQNYITINFLEISFLPFFSTGTFTVKYLLIFAVSFFLALKIPNVASHNFKIKYNWHNAFLLSMLILLALANLNKEVSFIYFQF